MTRYAVIGVCVLCSAGVAADRLPASRPAAGEGFEPLLVRAIQAEKTGQTGEALLLLQRAIGLLQTRLQEAMKATLPKPAEGWTATAPKCESIHMAMGEQEQPMYFTQVARTYRRTKDKLSVKLTVTNMPLMVEAQEQAFKQYQDPELLKMMNASPELAIKLVQREGWKGFVTTHKGQKTDLHAFVAGCLVSIESSKDDEQAVSTLFEGIDLATLAKATTPPAGAALRPKPKTGPHEEPADSEPEPEEDDDDGDGGDAEDDD